MRAVTGAPVARLVPKSECESIPTIPAGAPARFLPHSAHCPVLFNSFEFLLLFLPVALCAYYALARLGHAWALGSLVLASVVFYGFWNPRDVPILLGSIAINYALSTQLGSRKGKTVLIASIAANLALLLFFKWRIAEAGAGLSGTVQTIGLRDTLLPLGISFFTFTQIAYLVDVHRAKAKPTGPLQYLLFVTYFPHLMAGPLLYHGQVMPQFADRRTFTPDWDRFGLGLSIFAFGLFKKVGLADSVAPYGDTLFAAAASGTQLSFFEAWLAALAYGLQLYFDFSGYSDMAIGLSHLFGIRLPINFNSPYQAASLIDFWRRWHMSLSRFLRDYVYIPLGGSRNGPLLTSAALVATMVLGGVWHGLGWTFLLWGGLHGLLLAINHFWVRFRKSGDASRASAAPHRLAHRSAMLATFAVVTLLWVPFRADSLGTTWRMLSSMAGLHGISLPQRWSAWFDGATGPLLFDGVLPAGLIDARNAAILLTALTLLVWFAPNTMQIFSSSNAADRSSTAHTFSWRRALLAGAMLGAGVLLMGQPRTFLYFTF